MNRATHVAYRAIMYRAGTVAPIPGERIPTYAEASTRYAMALRP